MLNFVKKALAAALLGCIAGPALAADLYEPPVVEQPPPVVYEDSSYGGWYIRGDLDYHWSKMRGANYITYGCCGVVEPGTDSFDSTKLRGSASLGLGVGYQINKYLRTDFTGDYWFKSKFTGGTSGECGGVPCVSTDRSRMSALLLLANVYADLGTYHGITPYIGAGIGGAHIKWDDLENDVGTVITHRGAKSWRFAYAVMAGASYCLTSNLKLDAGYRFSRIQGGRMFEYEPTAGPGFDEGFNTHEVRGGLRYQFGKSDCAPPEQIAYEPEPIYTK